jgi:integrase/recombinase XerD
MNTQQSLGSFLHAFFDDHLHCQKGVRPSTIRSYSDAMRLFLQFVASHKRCKLTRLTLSDLTPDRVLLFLNHLENDRGNAVASRNQRLAALRCFFEYAACRQPQLLAEAHRVANVPVKRCAPPRTRYLERDEVEQLFRSLPTKGTFALRDRALLLFLYNTGARVQEVADFKIANLDLGEKPRVHLHGKGDKWRVCPLWKQSAELIGELMQSKRDHQDSPVFVSRTSQALTRQGIYKIVRRHTVPIFGTELAISPHSFRHTTATHLLESGVEINVIRAWLGHVSLETTNRYAEINLRMKAEALKTCELSPEPGAEHPRSPKSHDDSSLLNWLKSL